MGKEKQTEETKRQRYREREEEGKQHWRWSRPFSILTPWLEGGSTNSPVSLHLGKNVTDIMIWRKKPNQWKLFDRLSKYYLMTSVFCLYCNCILQTYLVSPVSRKISVTFFFKNLVVGGMPTFLGVNFGCEFLGALKPLINHREKCRNNSPNNLHRKLRAIFQKSPDQNKRLTLNPLCKTLGSRFWQTGSNHFSPTDAPPPYKHWNKTFTNRNCFVRKSKFSNRSLLFAQIRISLSSYLFSGLF